MTDKKEIAIQIAINGTMYEAIGMVGWTRFLGRDAVEVDDAGLTITPTIDDEDVDLYNAINEAVVAEYERTAGE
jgi:hypothetical protein